MTVFVIKAYSPILKKWVFAKVGGWGNFSEAYKFSSIDSARFRANMLRKCPADNVENIEAVGM